MEVPEDTKGQDGFKDIFNEMIVQTIRNIEKELIYKIVKGHRTLNRIDQNNLYTNHNQALCN